MAHAYGNNRYHHRVVQRVDLILMEFLEKLMFKLTGRKVPVFQIKDVDHQKVKTLRLSKWVDNPNTLLEKWDIQGAEKRNAGKITFIDDAGLSQIAYVEYLGQTVDLFVSQGFEDVPNREKVVGGLLTIDIFGELLDIGKSTKNILIGFIIGCIVYASFIGPMLGAMLK
jgi:hypothetical protein